MTHILTAGAVALAALLTACTSMAPSKPAAWSPPEVLVAPSSFAGVHGLAIDKRGRLLAGSVVGNALWEVDRNTGAAKILIGGPEGQADDIAIGPNGEMAWTNYLMGMLRYRENDSAPMRRAGQGPAWTEFARLRSQERQALCKPSVPWRRAVGDRCQPVSSHHG